MPMSDVAAGRLFANVETVGDSGKASLFTANGCVRE
jgi:hypothetical protein